MRFEQSYHLAGLLDVCLDDRAQERDGTRMVVGPPDERADVLREAAASESATRLQVGRDSRGDAGAVGRDRCYPSVEVNTLHHVNDVDIRCSRAQVADLV